MVINPQAFIDVIPFLIDGLWITLYITIFGVAIGCVIGTLFGLMSISRFRIVRFIAVTYVEVVRGTPLLAQIFFIHLGIPALIGHTFDPYITGVAIIGINSGAYIAEIVRGGVNSIDKGQMEAGRSLGLNSRQTMRYIIWPQALKVMIPPFGNQFVISLKDTSLLSSIAVAELMYSGRQYMTITFSAFETMFMVCIFYLIITIPASLLLRYLERRIDKS
ncbi:amino acid ABC transporter permease [Geomicrobium sediminis]|uniref:Glutamine transport system permease protein n=1 Tax=Geomicrobium sediminis TaxID=1347788 RepID=A0ABS2P9U5_9BACL|nr:amino acid ABC transporter permease [Geomicrobium sediminis]MBM7631618.1 glutamine transport system permease protein [Geomicrobium sediminis]